MSYRTRRQLRADIAEMLTELNGARQTARDAKTRAAVAEGERDAYKTELEETEQRLKAWRCLYRGAAEARDQLGRALVGENVTPPRPEDRRTSLRRAMEER